MTTGLQLGAPGVYRAPERVDRSFRSVRLDVAGFVGVAPRGPVDEPVLVQSWSDYELRFGGFEGPGLLPYAVSAFFEQGGERAYVVRVGPRLTSPAGADARARHRLDVAAATGEPVVFAASNEGSWGNEIQLRLELGLAQQFPGRISAANELWLPDGIDVPVGSLLRLRGVGLEPLGEFRYVDRTTLREVAPGRRQRIALLDRPLPVGTDLPLVGVVTAALVCGGGDRGILGKERIRNLGLHPEHPRFIGRTVAEESLLVEPVGAWTAEPVALTDPLLTPISAHRVTEGWDRYAEINGASFFDGPPDEPFDEDPFGERSHHGVDQLVREPEIALLVVPDLPWSWLDEPPQVELTVPESGAGFGPCPAPPVPDTYETRPRMVPLDARNVDELAEIVVRQQRLAAVAERYRRFVALLDVPSGLELRAIGQWRAGFDSSYAAAYHPWLAVTRTDVVRTGTTRTVDTRRERIEVPPAAFAAGIIAARERRLGLPWGPANELAAGAVLAAELVSDAEHDVLHQLGVNVFRAERDGFRLAAARTLSSDRSYRQLSVRRLITMLRLALDRQAQWVVFEPNTAALRSRLHRHLVAFLGELYLASAAIETLSVEVADDAQAQAFGHAIHNAAESSSISLAAAFVDGARQFRRTGFDAEGIRQWVTRVVKGRDTRILGRSLAEVESGADVLSAFQDYFRAGVDNSLRGPVGDDPPPPEDRSARTT